MQIDKTELILACIALICLGIQIGRIIYEKRT